MALQSIPQDGHSEVANGAEDPQGTPGTFDSRLGLEALASEQGVEPADDFDAALGDFWPEDEGAGEFVTALRPWRRYDWPFEISRAATIEGMEARYLTDESGERIGVVLDIAEYERLRRSAEEAARTERHPGIAFRGAEGSRRAWVPGTALDVWEIVAAYGEMGRERVLEESSVSGDRLDAALAYYKAHPDEIDQKIEENNRPPEYWRERYPNLNIQSIEY